MGFIQVLTENNYDEIAKSIGYGREGFTRIVNEGDRPDIEKLLLAKYGTTLSQYFDQQNLFAGDNQEQEDRVKVVDAEELLVHDSQQIKGMLRVILRNQAALLAAQEGKALSSILRKITKAVRDETSEEFGEL